MLHSGCSSKTQFMDQINRRLAFMFLFEFQLQHPDRQLLLFTPQVRRLVMIC